MGRSERWANAHEKKKTLSTQGTGPILYYENGRQYVYSGESHMAILGESGTGKSRRLIIPMVLNGITGKDKESFVIADPKGEIYNSTINAVSDEYEVFKFDFRHLYKDDVTCWNPLAAPYKLWKTGTDENVFRAEQMIEDLAHALYPISPNADPFWMSEARNVFEGAVYAIFSYAKPEEVNLTSLYYLIALGDEKYGASNYLKEFVRFALDDGIENVAMQLQSFVSTAPETRGGIRSSFLNRLSIAFKSKGVRDFLSNDDIDINNLRGDKPVIIYIILPDETPIYEELAGVLISQLMNHYIYIAENIWQGRLPIRMNFCLDELGNIGKAIGNLPHLLSAGRSRNCRVQLVLQSLSQLDDIYGKSNATTIISNTAVKVLYRVSNYETLSEFSRMCGEKETLLDNGMVKKEPLVTPIQLGSMGIGQALVMIPGTKFITWLPDYTEVFNTNESVCDKEIKCRKRSKAQTFDVRNMVKERKHEKLKAAGMVAREENDDVAIPFPNPFAVDKDVDIDAMIREIDKKIAELEEEERRENIKNEEKSAEKVQKNGRKRYSVIITDTTAKVRIIKTIMAVMNMSVSEAKYMYENAESDNSVPVNGVILSGLSKTKATQFKKKFEEFGISVNIKEE